MPQRTLSADATGLPKAREARRLVETTIARLIDLLDRLDPDPDLEPSLGWGTERDGCQYPDLHAVDPAAALDAEWDDGEIEHRGDTSDDEPSLGAPIGGMDQTTWAQGSADERESADDDGPRDESGGHARDARRMIAAVEAQLAALAARMRRQPPRRRRSLPGLIAGPDGALYALSPIKPTTR